MNDPKVNVFLESRFEFNSLDALKIYIEESNNSPTEDLMGIFDNTSKEHIGNIKLSQINKIHKFADIGIVIGVESFWGRGYATEAIKLMSLYAFRKLKLNKLVAGIYSENYGSIRAFEKSGFKQIGLLHQHRVYNGKYTDQLLLELLNDEKK